MQLTVPWLNPANSVTKRFKEKVFQGQFFTFKSFIASYNCFLTTFSFLFAVSIYLESVAILPQLFMVQKTGEAESITSHYLFALGSYRGLYILNWIYRYYAEGS